MLAAAIVVLQNVVPPEAHGLLERLTSTEGRYAVTAVVVMLALLIALVIAPLAIRQFRSAVGRRVPAGRLSRAFDSVGDVVPTTFSRVLLRSTQVAVLLAASLALLVVWGYTRVTPWLLLPVGVLALVGLVYGLSELDAKRRGVEPAARVTPGEPEPED